MTDVAHTSRGTCRACGADVLWVGPPNSRIPLDVHETYDGENRYKVDHGELVPVAATANAAAYADHRMTCWRREGVVTHGGSSSTGGPR